jgi:hypothetical protein
MNETLFFVITSTDVLTRLLTQLYKQCLDIYTDWKGKEYSEAIRVEGLVTTLQVTCRQQQVSIRAVWVNSYADQGFNCLGGIPSQAHVIKKRL